MHTRNAEVEGHSDLRVGRPSGSLWQDMGTRDPARHRFTFADDLMQVSLLITSEVNQVFVDHGVSSC